MVGAVFQGHERGVLGHVRVRIDVGAWVRIHVRLHHHRRAAGETHLCG